MAAYPWIIVITDSTITSGNPGVAGLTPTFAMYTKLSDLSHPTAPNITEVGGGVYQFLADPNNGEIGFTVDAGSSLSIPKDRYIFGTVDFSSLSQPQDLTSIGSAAATAILVTPSHKLATDVAGDVTYNNSAPPTPSAIATAAAAAILASPTHLLATDASGFVTYNNAAPPSTTAIGTAVAAALLISPANKLFTDGSGRVNVATVSDKTGYSLVQAFPTNFATMSISISGGVTVTTNNDKTGYVINQAFPANFASLAITTDGKVTAGTVTDKSGYSLTQTFPPNFSVLSITSGTGLVTATNGGGGGLTLDTPLSGHTTAGTVGGALANADVATSTRASASIIPGNFNLMAIDANGLLGLTPAQHTAIQADATAALTAQGYTSTRAGLLDRLDAAISSRVATGALPTNFSALSIDSSGNVTLPAAMQAAISGSVWDALTASHTANGSFGKLVEGFAGNPTPPTLSEIVAGVWNELTSGHTTAGSFATLLGTIATLAQTSVNFGAPPAASAIATACAAAILSIPGNKLVTDSAGAVAVNNFAAGLLDLADGIEAGVTVREGFRAFLSTMAGLVTGAGTDSLSFFAGGNPGTLRISATVDDQGNRTAITLHL